MKLQCEYKYKSISVKLIDKFIIIDFILLFNIWNHRKFEFFTWCLWLHFLFSWLCNLIDLALIDWFNHFSWESRYSRKSRTKLSSNRSRFVIFYSMYSTNSALTLIFFLKKYVFIISSFSWLIESLVCMRFDL